jgi:NADPH:quinone reductase-like Zn-dependent oxidoreductase
MKAVYSKKGGAPENLKVVERVKPVPKKNEVLIKVAYGSVTRGDVVLRTIPRPILVIMGAIFGFKPMDTPGVEVSGTIEAVGSEVTNWKVGDQVVGTTTGLGLGANAEYVCVPAGKYPGVLVKLPQGLDAGKATASVVGGMTAMQILGRLGEVSGKRVLVYGCSGSVGTFVAQIAKAKGASVVGVCSKSSMETIQPLGLEKLLDYNLDEWKKEKADIVIDAVGKLGTKQIKSLLVPGGSWGSVKRPTEEVAAELEEVLQFLAQGKIQPVIDREISLEEVADAHAYVATGRKKGNILVRVSG